METYTELMSQAEEIINLADDVSDKTVPCSFRMTKVKLVLT